MSILDAMGFGFTERMGGPFHAVASGLVDGKLDFNFEVDCPTLRQTDGAFVGTARGTVTMTGLADNAPAEGTLELAPFSKGTIRYLFTFTGTDGKPYRFDGHKTINWLHAAKTWTTLPAQVMEAGSGKAVAEVTARFNLKTDFWKLLGSFRRARKPA